MPCMDAFTALAACTNAAGWDEPLPGSTLMGLTMSAMERPSQVRAVTRRAVQCNTPRGAL